MTTYVADTHAVVWYLLNAPELSAPAKAAFEAAAEAGDPVYVTTITLVEIIYHPAREKRGRHRSVEMREVLKCDLPCLA